MTRGELGPARGMGHMPGARPDRIAGAARDTMNELEDLARWLDRQMPDAHWKDRIYSYCERGSDAGFWAEPWNAYTNFAFHIAALFALSLWISAPGGRRGAVELLLILLVAVIGTGSFLFHTLANRWSAMADVVPIALFMVVYVAYALRRFARFNWFFVLLGLAAFFGALYYAGQMRCEGGRLCLSGSVAYLPAFGALLLMGLGLSLFGRRAPGAYLLAGSAVFAVSLTFRTFDRAWCGRFEFLDFGHVGTHFGWHIFNALLLYLLLRAAIIHGAPAGREAVYNPRQETA